MRSSSTRRISCRRSQRTFSASSVSSRQLQSLSRDVAAELLASGARHEVPAAFAQTLDRHLYDLQDALRGPRERTEFKEWPASVIESVERLQALLDEFVASLGEAAKDHAGLAALRRRGAELAARLQILVAATKATSCKRAVGAIDDARHVAALRARRCGRATRCARRVAHECVDLHVGDARGRRQLRSLHRAARHARRHDGALRQPVQL